MNGYELTIRMRRVRRRCPLTAAEQALYYELVAICNEEGWEEAFSCSNEELCRTLCITENTLHSARQRLVELKLIFYYSGKSKRQYGQYSFAVAFTTATIEVNGKVGNSANKAIDAAIDSVIPTVTNEGMDDHTYERINKGVNTVINAVDYIKTKKKMITKGKQNGSKSHFDGSASPPENIIGNKKVMGEKEGTGEKEKMAHWPALTGIWMEFVQRHFGEKPSFKGADPKHFKNILLELKRRAAERNQTWTEAYACTELEWFLARSYADAWLRKNFLLSHLEKFMDKIILNQNGTHPGNNSKKPLAILVPQGSFGEL